MEATHDNRFGAGLVIGRDRPDGLPKPCTGEMVHKNSVGDVDEHSNWTLANRRRLASDRQPLCGQQGEDRALSNRSVKLPPCIGHASVTCWLKQSSIGAHPFSLLVN